MENKPTLADIKARVRVVCICKGIKQGKICDAILAGANTVDLVNKKTGSGNGGCGATRCRPVIEKLIASGGKIEEEVSVKTATSDEDFEW